MTASRSGRLKVAQGNGANEPTPADRNATRF
jgi:hypothetical protein